MESTDFVWLLKGQQMYFSVRRVSFSIFLKVLYFSCLFSRKLTSINQTLFIYFICIGMIEKKLKWSSLKWVIFTTSNGLHWLWYYWACLLSLSLYRISYNVSTRLYMLLWTTLLTCHFINPVIHWGKQC